MLAITCVWRLHRIFSSATFYNKIDIYECFLVCYGRTRLCTTLIAIYNNQSSWYAASVPVPAAPSSLQCTVPVGRGCAPILCVCSTRVSSCKSLLAPRSPPRSPPRHRRDRGGSCKEHPFSIASILLHGAPCKSLLDRVDVEEAIEVAIEERGGSCKETCREV